MNKRIAAAILALAVSASLLFGCAKNGSTVDLMRGITPNAATADINLDGSQDAAAADFAVTLFQASAQAGKNTLISPLSVYTALAMTANGADGRTLAQMESVLGMDVSALNEYMRGVISAFPQEKNCTITCADSIWFRDDERLTVNNDFLQANADYFGASIYKAPFNNGTLKDINTWVSDKTDGMIDKILDNIPDAAVMYLINAIAFDAEWSSMYYSHQVGNDVFTTESGLERSVDMMYSTEHSYLQDENATGFLKDYAGGKYAFAALLPNEGVSVYDYAASLSGESLLKTLKNAEGAAVQASIPKFSTEYSVEMNDILSAMGMSEAFNADSADFSKLGSSTAGNIFISRVLHKAFIDVTERGTKAGAATLVEAADTSAMENAGEIKQVYLDRPFVYMIVDTETCVPIFMGILADTQ